MAVLKLRLVRKVSELFRTAHYRQTARTSFAGSSVSLGGTRHLSPVNGISEIHQKSNPRQWRHVPTDFISADDATRGQRAKELWTDRRWFRGPEFLYKRKKDWP